MTEAPKIDSKNATAVFEETKKKYDALVLRRQRFQVELESSRRQFLEASREAELEFRTSNLTELRELFRTREATKIQDVLEFVMGVEDAVAELDDLEKQAS